MATAGSSSSSSGKDHLPEGVEVPPLQLPRRSGMHTPPGQLAVVYEDGDAAAAAASGSGSGSGFTVPHLPKLPLPSPRTLDLPSPRRVITPRVLSRKYMFIRTLGRGSYSLVKLARSTVSESLVAVKVISPNPNAEVDVVRVSRETKVLSLLRHPHITRLYEVQVTADHVYMVMEYASGGELFDYIVTRGRIREHAARRLFRQLVSAIGYCHANFLTHRDIKLENLLLDAEENIKLVDFGFVNEFRPNEVLSTACGTPAYAAPELLNATPYEGPHVDVWAMGVTLYCMVTGSLPFDHPDIHSLYDIVRSGKYYVPPELSDSVNDLIAGMLTVDPASRLTVQEIANHPWVNQGYDRVVDFGIPPRLPVSSPDPAILADLEAMGFPARDVAAALQAPSPSMLSSAYHLAVERIARDYPSYSVEDSCSGSHSHSYSISDDDDDDDISSQYSTTHRDSSSLVISPKSSRSDLVCSDSMSDSTDMGTSASSSIMTASADPMSSHSSASALIPPPVPHSRSRSHRKKSKSSSKRHSCSPSFTHLPSPPPASESSPVIPIDLSDVVFTPFNPKNPRVSMPLNTHLPPILCIPDMAAAPPSLSPRVIEHLRKERAQGVKQGLHTAPGRSAAVSAALASSFGTKAAPSPTHRDYASSSSHVAEDQDDPTAPRVAKGPFSVETTTTRPLAEAEACVVEALDDCAIDHSRSGYIFDCVLTLDKPPHLEFSVEICRMHRMANVLGIRFSRTSGDSWIYRRQIQILLARMRL